LIPILDRYIRLPSLLGWVCPLTLLGTYAFLACTGLAHDSVTFDELGHLTGGFSSWKERDHRLFPQNGQLPKRWGTLPLMAVDVRLPPTDHEDWQHSDVDRFGHQFLYETGNDLDMILLRSRTAMVVIGVVLGAAVFFWSKYLFGRVGGCISLALCTFSPSLIAHGRLVTSDVTAALMFVVALLCLWEVLHTITVGRVLCCAAAVGLLLVSKMSGLLIVPMAALLATLRLACGLPLHVALPRHCCVVRRLSRKLAYLLAIALAVSAGAFAVIWAFYDFRYSAFRVHADGRDRFYREESIDSLSSGNGAGSAICLARDLKLLPESYLFGLSHVLSHSRSHPAFMNGQYSLRGWTLFFPYAVLVKSPLPVFAIVAMAFCAAIRPMRDRVRSRRCNPRWTRRIILSSYRTAPLWVFILVYWTVSLRVHLSIGERHVLPTYPAAFILCGAAGQWIQNRHRLCTGTILVALVCLAAETVRIGPSYLSYFNQLAGGPAKGYTHLVDSSLDWGQDLGRLRQWLDHSRETNVAGGPVYLAYFGSGDPAYSGIEATLLPGYLDRRQEIDLQPLRPGTYCISATMLQSVYSPAFGPWNAEYERLYRRYSNLIASAYGTRVPLSRIKGGRSSEQERMIYKFEQLRFARLCEHLRRREPDDRVAYSILIYEVSAEELAAAIGEHLVD
jgi:hypothetical protein